MREIELKNIIEANMNKVYNICHQESMTTISQVIHLKLKFDTLIDILFSRAKIIKLLYLIVISKHAAYGYFNDLYYKNVNEMKKAAIKEEAKCSESSKESKEEISTEDSPKEILVPNKQLLGPNGKPIQSK